MKNTKLILVSLFLLFGASFNTLFAAHHGAKLPARLEVGERPESITKGFDGDYFVTVMNGKEEGDGVVKRIHGSKVTVFATGLDEPKGICFVGGYLFTTDLKKVRQIDSEGNVTILVDTDDFPLAVSYLNDAAAAPEGDAIYITDMGANTKMFKEPGALWPIGSNEYKSMPVIGRVYKIHLNGTISISINSNGLMTNPNGVGVGKDGQLMVGAFFKGNVLEQTDLGLSVIGHGMRGADAVEQDSKGNYYVSSWSQAKVWKIDAADHNVTILAEGLQSAADFYLEEDKGRLLLPDMKAGVVITVPIQ